jgi:PAS domain S-box-containing protein
VQREDRTATRRDRYGGAAARGEVTPRLSGTPDSNFAAARGALPAPDFDVTRDSVKAAPTTHATVKDFVRRFHNEILAEWKQLARGLSPANQMSALALIDHVPEMLEQIAELADVIARRDPLEPSLSMASRHALDRLQAGFEVSAVVEELSMLRDCISTVWTREVPSGGSAEHRAIHVAIDHAIRTSVAKYAETRERTLSAIDSISMAALESRSLGDLLDRLLDVFAKTTSAVDTAAIFLRDGDRLRTRAAVGLEEELAQGFSVAIGDGFAGTIAEERRPIALRSAYLDPSIRSEVIRKRRVRALYGVPLVHGDELIGVACMGSIVAEEFSHGDRQFFGSMAARATIGIVHHLLRQDLQQSESSQRKIAEERERALAKLESLLAASTVGIAFVDRELRYIRVNESLAALNGKPVADHIGRTIREVLHDGADKLEPLLRRVLETGQSEKNIELALPDGRTLLANYFPVRASSGEVRGVGAIVLDVTEEKRTLEALRFEQTRLQSILEHAPAAIWIKDNEGRIVVANQRLAEALGHPFERIIGRRSEELLPAAIAEEHRQHDEIVMRENRALEVEEVAPSPDGDRTFLAIKFPIPHDPPLVGAIATEITERKKMEDELRVAVRMREDLLAVVSHDLRNPLGTIMLSASMLQQAAQLDPRSRRHVEMIHRSSIRMETLIDDLLDSANIRAGRLTLEVKREPLDVVLAEAVELQHPIAEEKGVTLLRKDGVTSLDIMCDRSRVLQVFSNMIGNAIKFCRSGDRITVATARDGDFIRFSVADTGPGIKPDALAFLFDAYWSGPQDARHGSGLGLFISRGIVEGHGGRIWVESTPGEGATFYFTLPIAK